MDGVANADMTEAMDEWGKGNFDYAGKAFGDYFVKLRGRHIDFQDLFVEDHNNGNVTSYYTNVNGTFWYRHDKGN